MAQYEHLPIYKKAMDLAIFIENIVRRFSKYHKYTLGTDLRNISREVVRLIIRANSEKDKKATKDTTPSPRSSPQRGEEVNTFSQLGRRPG